MKNAPISSLTTPAPTENTEAPKRNRLNLQTLLELLVKEQNVLGYVLDPKGRSLPRHLSEKLGFSSSTILKALKELASMGYIQLEERKGSLYRARIKKDAWDENLVATTPIIIVEEAQRAFVRKGPRTFLVFLDWENLARNISRGNPQEKLKRLSNFSWLLNPIIAKGKTLLALAFVTNNEAGLPPIMQLSHQGFYPVLCPRQLGVVATKEKDTVDAKLDEVARVLIEHSDATDVIVIAGDADFQPLVNFARFHQKTVTVVSASQAISGRFLEMEKRGDVTVKLV